MSVICENSVEKSTNFHMDASVQQLQDDVVQPKGARVASAAPQQRQLPKPAEPNDGEVPAKKRKTRRGKSKRRHPYIKGNKAAKLLNKPEAPHNSNQFLLEDHGLIEDLDENLKGLDQVSTSTVTRTRDSSFSVDSEGDFYSSPDDEEKFLIKDFVEEYESVQAERLQAMSKAQLIEEYQQLENKFDAIQKRLQKIEEKDEEMESTRPEMQRELERLMIENERLRRENELLRSKINSDSEDSETDSSDSCSSSNSSSSSTSGAEEQMETPPVDYSQTNGHTNSTSASPTSQPA